VGVPAPPLCSPAGSAAVPRSVGGSPDQRASCRTARIRQSGAALSLVVLSDSQTDLIQLCAISGSSSLRVDREVGAPFPLSGRRGPSGFACLLARFAQVRSRVRSRSHVPLLCRRRLGTWRGRGARIGQLGKHHAFDTYPTQPISVVLPS
jgi:hypothetical protein